MNFIKLCKSFELFKYTVLLIRLMTVLRKFCYSLNKFGNFIEILKVLKMFFKVFK